MSHQPSSSNLPIGSRRLLVLYEVIDFDVEHDDADDASNIVDPWSSSSLEHLLRQTRNAFYMNSYTSSSDAVYGSDLIFEIKNRVMKRNGGGGGGYSFRLTVGVRSSPSSVQWVDILSPSSEVPVLSIKGIGEGVVFVNVFTLDVGVAHLCAGAAALQRVQEATRAARSTQWGFEVSEVGNFSRLRNRDDLLQSGRVVMRSSSNNSNSNNNNSNNNNNSSSSSNNNSSSGNSSGSSSSYKSNTPTSSSSSSSSYSSDDSMAANITSSVSTAAWSLFSLATDGISSVTGAIGGMNLVGVVGGAGGSLSRNKISRLQVVKLNSMKVGIVKEIAQGGFGTIYLAEPEDDADDNRTFALKKMLCQSREQEADAIREVEALQRLASERADHCIPLIDHSTATDSSGRKVFMLLFPMCNQGSIWSVIENSTASSPWPFSEKQALQMVLGIAKGLLAIHNIGWSHRDMKPHNVLLSDEGMPYLTDFGSIATARVAVTNRSQALNLEEEAASKTSAAYRPPELTTVNYPSKIDERVDIWGLGCSMFCIAFGRSPFELPKEGISRLAILNGKFSFPPNNRMRDKMFGSAFCQLVSDMLNVNSDLRPFASQVINTCELLLSKL